MAIVVELLSRSNAPIEHYYFDQAEITVGRGFDNDLRIDDPYVCPNHLTLITSADPDSVEFRDLATLNGTKKNAESTSQGNVHAEDVLCIGRTRLRIFNAAHQVAPTIRLSELEENISWMNNWWALLLLTGITAGMLLVSEFLTSFEPFKLTKALPQITGQLLLFSMWPMFFALLSKLAKKESRLLSQFCLLWIFLLITQALTLILSILGFNLPGESVIEWFSILSIGAAFFVFTWFSLFVAFHQSKRRRNFVTSLVVAVVLLPVIFYRGLDGDDHSSRPSYDATLLPPMYQLVEPSSTEDFISHSDSLFEQIDEINTSQDG